MTGGEPSHHMDVSRAAFPKSFYALIAAGVILGAGLALERDTGASSAAAIGAIALILFLLTAPTVIYLVCHLISRSDLFRPWVIVRNWAVLIVSILAFAIMALSAAGLLPVQIASPALMLLYIGTLLMDIRLGQTMAKMNWTPAIFIACAISVSGMLVLLAVFASAAGY